MELISVIVPVYKVEKYLNQCIDSIINQTYKNLEIILVDDGSPDICGKICDEYALKDKRIKVIHKKNEGLSAARNSGIDASTGDYLCFVDSDDIISPEYCQVLYDLLKDNDYEFSVCGVCRFKDGYDPTPKITNLKENVWKSDEFLREQLNKRSEFGVWNKLYRRSIFSKMRFEEGRLNEDVIWSGDLAINTKKCIESKSQHYYYRQRENSIVANQSITGSIDFLYAANYLIKISSNIHNDIFYDSLYYALDYQWSFVDKIYIERTIIENYLFLNILQNMIRNYYHSLGEIQSFSKTRIHRMKLFCKSKILYAINAYFRLANVYLHRLLNKDPYKNEHWI